MQAVLKGTAQKKAEEAMSGAFSSNKKIADMKPDTHETSSKIALTSDFGVKQSTHDEWLSASTGDRQGPQLLEDNFSREKVSATLLFHCFNYSQTIEVIVQRDQDN